MMSYTELRQVATDVAGDFVDYDWSRILMMIMAFFAAMLAPSLVIRVVLFLYAFQDIWQTGAIFNYNGNPNTMDNGHSRGNIATSDH